MIYKGGALREIFLPEQCGTGFERICGRAGWQAEEGGYNARLNRAGGDPRRNSCKPRSNSYCCYCYTAILLLYTTDDQQRGAAGKAPTE